MKSTMKFGIALPILLLTLHAVAADSPCDTPCGAETTVLSVEQEDGSRLFWSIPRERLKARKNWTPEDEPPPLPIAEAVKIGSKWLATKHPEINGFTAHSVGLNSFHDYRNPNPVWYYHIEYFPIVSGATHGGTTTYSAVLMLDGYVIEPTKSK